MAILTDDERMFYGETAEKLKGPDRRRFMALSVHQLGPGGKALAARELGWCPETILKGLRELESGVPVIDDYSACGRKSAEEHLPNLIADIRELGFPLFSTLVMPTAGEPKGFGETGVPIRIAGVRVAPGDWIIGDDDGVCVVPKEKALEYTNRAMDILERENRLRQEIRQGSTLSQVAYLLRWEKK